MQRATLPDRIGITSRLLFASLLSVVLAVVAVQGATLLLVRQNQLDAVQARLEGSLALLKQKLQPLGNTWSVGDAGELKLGYTALNGRNDMLAELREVTGAVATVFAEDTRVATSVVMPDGRPAVGTKLAAGPAAEAVHAGRTYRGQADIFGQRYLTIYEPVLVDGKQLGILFVGVALAEAEQAILSVRDRALEVGTGVILIIGLLRWWMLRRSLRPLVALSEVMRRIASGALDTPVPCITRTDQLGDMARALLQLRDASAQARALAAEAERVRGQADAEKHAAMRRMAESVERQTAAAAEAASAGGADLAAIADAMAASAARSAESVRGADDAAGLALSNAQTVAGAAEELSASIREIAQQVGQSTQIVSRAVGAGQGARAVIEALTERVGRIGAMTGVIADIAGRTNLLALNATIEAARAGEAGRGFAVVAGEVKQLATQTARSTEDIGRHIAEVRTATAEAVAAVGRIELTIGEIDGIAGSIAAAVEEQGAATGEIARNVAETASAARVVAERIAEVGREVEQTGACATEVRARAGQLSGAVAGLRRTVVTSVRSTIENAAA